MATRRRNVPPDPAETAARALQHLRADGSVGIPGSPARKRFDTLLRTLERFIRSMASRGQSGGLAAATRDIVTVFDAFGMDLIIIETVGIEPVELDVIEACDTVVVVLGPRIRRHDPNHESRPHGNRRHFLR